MNFDNLRIYSPYYLNLDSEVGEKSDRSYLSWIYKHENLDYASETQEPNLRSVISMQPYGQNLLSLWEWVGTSPTTSKSPRQPQGRSHRIQASKDYRE